MGFSVSAKQDPVGDLLHLFVKRVPNAGRTQLVKFLYLTDLASRQFLGRPMTDLEYIWYDHGPFDSRILNRLSHLEETGKIRATKVRFNSSHGYRYVAKEAADTTWLTERQTAIINHVIEEYGKMTLSTLLRHVYDTPPMALAKKHGKKSMGKPLNMSTLKNDRELFEAIREGVDQLDRGERVPFLTKRKSDD